MLIINVLSTAGPRPKFEDHATAYKFENKNAKGPDIGCFARWITKYLLRGPET